MASRFITKVYANISYILYLLRQIYLSLTRTTFPIVSSIVNSFHISSLKSGANEKSRFLSATLITLCEFFENILLSHSSEVSPLLFSFVEQVLVRALSQPQSQSSSLTFPFAGGVSFFRVLTLGLRLIKLSFRENFRISILRRRIFRENIAACAFKYCEVVSLAKITHKFDDFASNKTRANRTYGAEDEVSILNSFLLALHGDSKFWTLDCAQFSKGASLETEVGTGGIIEEKFGPSAATAQFYNEIYRPTSHRMPHRSAQLLSNQLAEDRRAFPFLFVDGNGNGDGYTSKKKLLQRQSALGKHFEVPSFHR